MLNGKGQKTAKKAFPLFSYSMVAHGAKLMHLFKGEV